MGSVSRGGHGGCHTGIWVKGRIADENHPDWVTLMCIDAQYLFLLAFQCDPIVMSQATLTHTDIKYTVITKSLSLEAKSITAILVTYQFTLLFQMGKFLWC